VADCNEGAGGFAGAGGNRGASVWASANAAPSTHHEIVSHPFNVVFIGLSSRTRPLMLRDLGELCGS